MATSPSFGYGVAGHKNTFGVCSGALVGNWVEDEFGRRALAAPEERIMKTQSEVQSAYRGEPAEKTIPVSHEGLSAELMFHHHETFRGDEPSLKIGTIHSSTEKMKARKDDLACTAREVALRRSEALASTQNVQIRPIVKKEEDDPLPNFRRRKVKSCNGVVY